MVSVLPVSGIAASVTLTAKVLRHVRAITGNQVHVGGDDNQRVLQHVCLEFPGEMLLLQTTTLLARLVDIADPMISAPVLDRLRRVGEELGGHCRRYHEECRRAAEYFRVTQTEAVVRPQDGAPLEAVVSGRDGLKVAKLVCDRCFLCLPDLKALKAHTRQQHDYSIPHMPGPFQRDKHGKDGMPTCLHCDRRFPSWSHLERHIREHNCEVHWLKRQEAGLSPDQPDEPAPLATTDQVDADGPNLPLARRAQVKSACLRDGWKSLLGDASLCAEMVNHCVLCHQWVDQTQIKIHTRRVHSAEWQRFQAEVTLECKQLARVAVSPCRWCGAVVKRASEHSYKCSVAWQACFLGRLLTDDSDGCGGRDDAHPSLLTPKTQTGDGMPLQSEGAKRKPEHQGKRPPGKGTGKGRGRQRGNGADSSHGRLAHQQPDLLDLLIKLVLRHEAFLGRLQQDMVYIFTFKNQPNAPDSLLPVLYQVSQEWREKYQTNPSSLDRSLRVTILLCLLTELLKRHRRLEDTGAEEALKAIKGAGWMSEDGKWVHQMWNHAEAKLVTDEARGTMTLAEGTEHLRTMLRLLAQPEVLLKFAATRPLAQEMSGHQISFICELSLRHPAADQMFAMIGKWWAMQCCTWLDCGFNHREDGFPSLRPRYKKGSTVGAAPSLCENWQHLLYELLLCCNFVGNHP